MQRYAPQAKSVFHDSFLFGAELWNDLFSDNATDVVIDHHQYWAFAGYPGNSTLADFCGAFENEAARADEFKFEVWLGEWALATDNCAHWLNGLNRGVPNQGFKCAKLSCPQTYMPDKVDFDRNADILGPFGDSNSTLNSIQKGQCFTDSLNLDQGQVRELAKCAQAS